METQKIIFDVPSCTNAELKKIARDKGLTKTAIVKWAISDFLREEKFKNDRTRINPEN
jgi:predicted transcriptional regulator